MVTQQVGALTTEFWRLRHHLAPQDSRAFYAINDCPLRDVVSYSNNTAPTTMPINVQYLQAHKQNLSIRSPAILTLLPSAASTHFEPGTAFNQAS